jgi:acyl-coenzyme A thioesterase PaaI-like protein
MSSEFVESLPSQIRDIMNIREIIRDEKRGCITLILDPSPDVLTYHGEPHGGYISLISMVGAELAATHLLKEEEILVVINHTVNFLKHVEVYNQEVDIESCVLSKGERVIYIETKVRCRGEDIAQALTSFITEKRY